MTASWRARTRSLVVTVAVALAILVAGEIGLRLFAYYFRLPYQVLDPRLGMIRLVPNFHAKYLGAILRINSRGFRGAEFTPEKPHGVVRIITLGDSVTFGLAGDGCHYPAALQRRFDEEAPGRVEVINAGVEGYDAVAEARWLETVGLNLFPEIVVVGTSIND